MKTKTLISWIAAAVVALIAVSATSATTLPNQELKVGDYFFPAQPGATTQPEFRFPAQPSVTTAAEPEVRIPAQPTAVTPEPVPAAASGEVKVGEYFFPAQPSAITTEPKPVVVDGQVKIGEYNFPAQPGGSTPIEIVAAPAGAPSDGFSWSDAGVGAAIALGAVILALGAALLVRNRHRLAQS